MHALCLVEKLKYDAFSFVLLKFDMECTVCSLAINKAEDG
jgi:hypothetical protein